LPRERTIASLNVPAADRSFGCREAGERLSSAVAGAVKLNSLTDMFKIIADVTTLINVVVILNCAVLIVSTGLLFVLKGGAT